MAQVCLDGVTKRFGETVAVDELSLDIADGEFMVLLGPSGCGKSTALRMIAGLEALSGGELKIGDTVVNDFTPDRRDVSMVFQSYALYPHMTVEKNIESPLVSKPTLINGETRKLTSTERAERVAAAVKMLGLEKLVDRKPGALSGGQRQRVALARAVVSRPAVYLMDEPLSNLDAKLRTQTRAELIDLHSELKTTVIYVTHDQTEAMTMATRVAVLADGRLQQVGSPREVYEVPANVFVATFIGSPGMNTATVTSSEGGIALGGGKLPIERLPAGRQLVIGVRPEHLVIDSSGPISATVHHTEWLGHEALVSVELNESSSTRWVVRLGGGAGVPANGEQVHLTLSGPSSLHLFEAESGQRVEVESLLPSGASELGR